MEHGSGMNSYSPQRTSIKSLMDPVRWYLGQLGVAGSYPAAVFLCCGFESLGSQEMLTVARSGPVCFGI